MSEVANQVTSFKALIAERRGRFDEIQISKAVKWILDKFKSVISWENEIAIIWFKRFLSDPFYRKEGWTKLPDDWSVKVFMKAEEFSLLYIDIILDESISESEKMNAIIQFDKDNSIGHAPMLEKFPDWPVDLNVKFD